ncbi:hypothetical protein Tco_0267663 [Tanacetum coccineum]
MRITFGVRRKTPRKTFPVTGGGGGGGGSGGRIFMREREISESIEDKQASKEAVIRYYNDITTGSPSPSSSSSTRPMIKDDSDDIARRIRDCKEEDLARIISEIRSSPSTSEDLFQDSQDPYDM